MRFNRKMRIGAASLAVALLLFGLFSVIRNLSRRATTPPADNTVATGTENRPATIPASSESVAYVREALPARSIVTLDMLEMRAAPANSALRSTDANANLRPVTDPQTQAVGFITQRALSKGSPLVQGDLVGHISQVGIAGALMPGTRAMIVPITNKSTLHDLIRIGDRVDVLASFDQQEARTVVQDVRVLAVDVFGKDFPQVKIAMRGDYKAPAADISTANPASPNGAARTNSNANPDAPGARPAEAGPAQPEPTPVPSPPATRPDPALTLEVTPQQATAISLTQAAGQNLDFLIRPHNEPTIVALAPNAIPGATPSGVGSGGVGEVQAASTTRDRLAPGAWRLKNAATPKSSNNNSTRVAAAESGGGRSSRPPRGRDRDVMPGPDIPTPTHVTEVPPWNPGKNGSVTVAPPTYEIPVYGDGKLVRVETVKKPQE